MCNIHNASHSASIPEWKVRRRRARSTEGIGLPPIKQAAHGDDAQLKGGRECRVHLFYRRVSDTALKGDEKLCRQ
eukprot:1158986-Pelagomonas_calceolata.AAC.3